MIYGMKQQIETLFIVRMWEEDSASASRAWRGCVEQIPSGKRHYFDNLRTLNEFLQAWLNAAIACQPEPEKDQKESWEEK